MPNARISLVRRAAALAIVSLAPAIPISCGGAGLVGQVYRDGSLSFRIGQVPPSWQPLDVSHVRVAFRDASAQSSVFVNARCGNDGEDVPLTALTAHLFLTFTEREVVEQRTEPLDGREALHTVLRAKLDGVAKMFDVYVMKKDGCVYDFVDVSAPESFPAQRSVFQGFVAGFHTLSSGGDV